MRDRRGEKVTEEAEIAHLFIPPFGVLPCSTKTESAFIDSIGQVERHELVSSCNKVGCPSLSFFSVDVQDSLRNQEKRGVSLIPKPAPKSLIDLDDAAVEKKVHRRQGEEKSARALLPSIHFP